MIGCIGSIGLIGLICSIGYVGLSRGVKIYRLWHLPAIAVYASIVPPLRARRTGEADGDETEKPKSALQSTETLNIFVDFSVCGPLIRS